MAVFYLILGIILFVGLVIVHEWGHFIFARRNGVKVEEFGIGFPPRIWAKKVKSKKGDFEFSINWLFLGGFVRLKGEHDSDTRPGSFGAASTSAKTKIMAAGVGMNLLTALIIFTAVAWIGMPQLIDNQFTVPSDSKIIRDVSNKGVVKIGFVDKGSAAAGAGLQVGDRVISVGGTTINTPNRLIDATKRLAGQSVQVVTEHNGQRHTARLTLHQTSPYMGVAPVSGEVGFQVRRATWSAPIVAIGVARDFTIATVKGLGTAVKGLGSIIAGLATGNSQARTNGQTAASDQLSGPIGIMKIVYRYASQGFGFVLFIIGLISLSLAIMNILPIPALDGGKLFFTYISRLFGRQISEGFENYAYGISFILLIGLMVVISVIDIRR